MQVSHGVQGIVGTAIGGGGFAGFWVAADPYVKCFLAVLTIVALTTTIMVNRKKLREKKD